MIIGVTGYKGTGKNEVGKILEHWGFYQVALADAVKSMALAIDPWVLLLEPRKRDEIDAQRLSWIVESRGWEAAKEEPEVRRILQRLGTEAGREVLGNDVWIKALQKRMASIRVKMETRRQPCSHPRDFGGALHEYDTIEVNATDFVITDVRFKNEADWVQNLGGKVWKVTRPGCESDGHASEVGVDLIEEDVTIVNDGTLDDLWQQVTGALGL